MSSHGSLDPGVGTLHAPWHQCAEEAVCRIYCIKVLRSTLEQLPRGLPSQLTSRSAEKWRVGVHSH